MSDSSIKLINALIVFTQQGDISWKIREGKFPGKLFDGASIDGHIYESEVKEKTVLLFRFTNEYTDEHDNIAVDYSFRLVLIDDSGCSEMEIDDKFSLSTLYEIVREKCHGVSAWIDKVVEPLQSFTHVG